MSKWVKSAVLTVVALVTLCVVILAGFFVVYGMPGGELAPGITARGITLVKLGMTYEQVEAILGRPYEIVSQKGSWAHKLGCQQSSETVQALEVTATTDIQAFFRRIATDTTVHACDQDSEHKRNRQTTFHYTRRGGFARSYPMLWVHFDSTARVENVYAKEYDADDYCIYSLGEDTSQNIQNKEALRRLFSDR